MAITLTFPQGGALVTGGTGRVGEGIVRKLAQAGVPQVFTYRGNKDGALALEAELRDAGHQVAAMHMDLTDVDSIRPALDRVVRDHGRLHSVLCGSGPQVGFDKVANFSIEDMARFLDADAMGVFRLIHLAVPMMRESGGGSITPCVTIATRKAIAFDGMSPFSKGAVDALVRYVAAEEAEHGIRCNSVAIGWVEDRPMEDIVALMPTGVPTTSQTQVDRINSMMLQLIENARLGRPVRSHEAGDTFAFLASDQAAHLTGQCLTLDAGILL